MRIILIALISATVLFASSCSQEEIFEQRAVLYETVVPDTAATTGNFELKEVGGNIAFGTLTIDNPSPGVKYVAVACWNIFNAGSPTNCLDLNEIPAGGTESTTELFFVGRVANQFGQQPDYRFGYSEFAFSEGSVRVYENDVDPANLAFTILMNQ